MNKFKKQPSEIFSIVVDFTDVLESAETIASHTVTAKRGNIDSTALVINSSSIVAKTIKIRVQGGLRNRNYKITTAITTSLENVFEYDLKMVVREI